MRVRVGWDNHIDASEASPGAAGWLSRPLAALGAFRARRRAGAMPVGGASGASRGPWRGELSYTMDFDQASQTARVAFRRAISRPLVAGLAARLADLDAGATTVFLDVSQARNLDVRSLATLALLSSSVERAGGTVSVQGVPDALRRLAIAAGVHYFLPIE